jgi:23S rRNA (cytosine1962-C5)-methyltransferase
VFSGSVEKVVGALEPGETVRVISAENEFLGWGAYNPSSSIRIRMWHFNEEPIDTKFFEEKLRIAISLRDAFIPKSISNARRLIYAESDGIPGLIVDQYGDYLVTQFLTRGIEIWKNDILNLIGEITGFKNVFNRSDLDIRHLEGLQQEKGLIRGKEPPDEIEIYENGIHYLVDIKNGQKTGFFLDQRQNRNTASSYAHQKNVLNCFCFTGGFSINAAKAGADSVTSIDSSAEAIELAKRNFQLNELDPSLSTWIVGDVFNKLRVFRDQGRNFDMIILDPPKFAPTKSQVSAASRGYKDINLLAFKLLWFISENCRRCRARCSC